jgi:uncharacterized protein (TIGR01777 family)
MKVLVTGASGLLGSALVSALAADGHEVVRLIRRAPQGAGERQWQPNGEADPRTFDGADAVVHLAGEGIASGRWSPRRKAAIRDSRMLGTRTVATSIAAAAQPPRVLISASGSHYYGDRGSKVLSETTSPGTGFLAEVCQRWEAETEPARQAGVRVVRIRTSLVLAAQGGALQKMLLPFRMGVGGRIGSGQQWWSWIALDDYVGLLLFALKTSELQGPVNAASPNPVTNAGFTRILGKVLRRPTIVPLPEFAVRLVMGEMGQELLLSSQRIQPVAAASAGFVFRYPMLQQALEHLL